MEGVLEVVGDACIKVVVGVFAGGFCRDPREVFGDAPDVRVDWEFRSSKAYRVRTSISYLTSFLKEGSWWNYKIRQHS